MKLNLDSRPPGHSELAVDERIPLETDDADTPELGVSGSLSVDNAGDRVLIRGTLQVQAAAVCNRCLGDFTQAYPAELTVEIVRMGRAGTEEPDEIWVIHQAQGEVDLGDVLREAALLARPLKQVCDEECRGLCPVCGGNRNQTDCDCSDETTDPRWDALPS
jgi:uncharacterized protein